MKEVVLPGKRRVWCTARGDKELEVVYEEIFEMHTYEQGGVRVRDGDVVVDVGANIGLFAICLLERYRDLRVVCIEPAPPTRACLERNLEGWEGREGHEITTLPWALGAREDDAVIEFLPGLPANSSVHPGDKRAQLETVVQQFTLSDLWHLNRSRPAVALMLVLLTLLIYPFRRIAYRRVVQHGMDGASRFPCKVRPLDAVLEECALTRVDLLKVDVEGAELEVLEGLGSAGLARVRQLAIEIEPYHKPRLPALMARLTRAGFESLSVQGATGTGDGLDDPYPCMLYAVRTAETEGAPS
jgi:nonribosomal peptide synthetase DhbF